MAKTTDKELRRFIHAPAPRLLLRLRGPGQPAQAFKASVGGNVAEVAGQLTLPVLLIAGEKDEIAMLPDQHRLAALLPDGTLEVIPGVGHLIHYETPDPPPATSAAS